MDSKAGNGLYLKALDSDFNMLNEEEKANIIAMFSDIQTTSKTQCLELFRAENFEALGELINNNRLLSRKIKSIVDSYEDQYILMLDRYIQNLATYNRLLKVQNKGKDFDAEVNWIVSKHKNAGSVLSYLFKNPHAQFSSIQTSLRIPKSSLSDLMKVLVENRCVKRIKSTKYVFYILTVEGKRYVSAHYEDKIKVDFIETDLLTEDFDQKYKFTTKKYNSDSKKVFESYVAFYDDCKSDQDVFFRKVEYHGENDKSFFDEVKGEKLWNLLKN